QTPGTPLRRGQNRPTREDTHRPTTAERLNNKLIVGLLHGLDAGDPELFYLYRPGGDAVTLASHFHEPERLGAEIATAVTIIAGVGLAVTAIRWFEAHKR
ncbi:hypothetical protein ABZS95_38470, partial [Streptomyces sp. NPDC005479]